jgi:hypothetical protein
MNLTESWQDSLEGGSVRHKAATYTIQHRHWIEADRYQYFKWDSNPRSHCLSGLLSADARVSPWMKWHWSKCSPSFCDIPMLIIVLPLLNTHQSALSKMCGSALSYHLSWSSKFHLWCGIWLVAQQAVSLSWTHVRVCLSVCRNNNSESKEPLFMTSGTVNKPRKATQCLYCITSQVWRIPTWWQREFLRWDCHYRHMTRRPCVEQQFGESSASINVTFAKVQNNNTQIIRNRP